MKRLFLLVYVAFTAACGGHDVAQPQPEGVVALTLVSGDGQLAKPSARLREPLVVGARNERGEPLAGVTVTWSVTPDGGSVAPNVGVTDASGRVSTTWTLGPAEGIQTATATTTAGSKLNFEGRALARARPIAFLAYKFGYPRLFMMNPDGGDIVQLTTLPAESPLWSPDGNRLAFIAGEVNSCSSAFGDLYVVDVVTMSENQLTHNDRCSLVWSTTWSPDGSKIAFVRDKQIVVINADGSGERIITVSNEGVDPAVRAVVVGLAWYPDGSGFVFGKRFAVNQPYSLMAINADGSGERQLTPRPGVGVIGFSPDGSKLVVVYQGDLWYDLTVWLINPDGSGGEAVPGSAGIFGLTWSPDGTKWLATVYQSYGCVGSGNPGLVMFDITTGEATSGTSIGGCGTGGAAWRR